MDDWGRASSLRGLIRPGHLQIRLSHTGPFPLRTDGMQPAGTIGYNF
jgi:hypothetical protein